MVVMEKEKDIAILKSMGATSRSIMKIFFFQGWSSPFPAPFSGSRAAWVFATCSPATSSSSCHPMSIP